MKSTRQAPPAQLELALPRAGASPAHVTEARHAWFVWLQSAAEAARRETYRSNLPHSIVLVDARERITVSARCELAVALTLVHRILDAAEEQPPHVQPRRVLLIRSSGDTYREWELGAGDRYSLVGGAS